MRKLFLLFRLVSRLNFHLPVIIVFMAAFVADIFTIAILTAIYTLASAIVISTFSRREFNAKWMVLAGEFSKVAGLAILIAGRDYASLLALQLLSGLGHGLSISGESKFVRQLLAGAMSKSQTSTFVQVYLAFAVTGIAGVFMFLRDPIYPFAASMAANSVAFLLIAAIRAPKATAPAGAFKAPPAFRIDARMVSITLEFVLLRALPLAILIFYMPIKLFFVMKLDIYWLAAFLIVFTLSGAAFGAYIGTRMKLFRRAPVQAAFLIIYVAAVGIMLFSQSLPLLLASALYLGSASAVSRPQAAYRIEQGLEDANQALIFRAVNFFELVCAGFIAVTIMALAWYVAAAFGASVPEIQTTGS